MRTRSLFAAPLVLAAALAGCTAGTPATTVLPSAVTLAPSATASPSARPTAAAPTAPTPVPSDPASPAVASPPAAAGGAGHGAHGTVEVTMVDFAFEPAESKVKAGQTVRWTNEGGQPHTVKTDDGTISSPIVLGEPFEWTAEGASGTIVEYFCGIHPSMTGTITITD